MRILSYSSAEVKRWIGRQGEFLGNFALRAQPELCRPTVGAVTPAAGGVDEGGFPRACHDRGHEMCLLRARRAASYPPVLSRASCRPSLVFRHDRCNRNIL
jgi:hypothetical protein